MKLLKSLKKLCFFFFVTIAIISWCNNQKYYQIKSQIQQSNVLEINSKIREQHTITVWIHGTRTISLSTLPLLKRFFKNYFGIDGLHPAQIYTEKNNMLSIAKTLHKTDPESFPFEDIYIFGWSGVLSPQARFEAAIQLYEELLTLSRNYVEKYQIKPRIRLITHSHGGNVALYLAQREKDQQENLVVDEFVILACPVQKETSHLLKSEMFKSVYSFYSTFDFIQTLDPQGAYNAKKQWSQNKKAHLNLQEPFFSERMFESQENLKQMLVKENGRPILHSEFIHEQFVARIPGLLHELR